MAVRHQVENLIRRGNIFYWRARVPMSFARCRPGSRFHSAFTVPAQALFDMDDRHALADRNLSEFTGGSRQNRRANAPQAAQTEGTPIAAQPSAPANKSPTASPAEPPAIVTLDLRPAPPPNVPERGEASNATPVILVADFEAECEKLIKNMKDAWDASTAREARALVRMFKDVLEEKGVEHTGQITQYHIGELRQFFNNVPTRWGQSARMRVMSAPELRAEGQKLREQAEEEGKEAAVGLRAATIRKHIGNLNHFLKHVRGHGFEVKDWTFEGLRPKKPRPLQSAPAVRGMPLRSAKRNAEDQRANGKLQAPIRIRGTDDSSPPSWRRTSAAAMAREKCTRYQPLLGAFRKRRPTLPCRGLSTGQSEVRVRDYSTKNDKALNCPPEREML
ncbi:hypothetical protein [Sinorhizobium terangae]|uniref:hypothetical protein n=1 Tax=Sinorhizobium terangae TaxID=110322 RepID=UPI0024B1814D|nr:hypothetical protein [Sinorhizobium terangae]WFU51300.1 hypothetical protein QA637_22275 [Sinorhizobium terangae]